MKPNLPLLAPPRDPFAASPQGRTEAMLQLFHVSKRYDRGGLALDDVSLRIDKGEFLFLTGASGAGKSTLLKLLFMEERASTGQILLAGHALHRLRRASVPLLRRRIGVVFQDFKLLASRTVLENVAFVLEVLGRPAVEVRRRSIAMLGAVGLAEKMHLRPQQLSGGEQQRVAIARALVNEPSILLADEPTGNLDPTLTYEVMDLMMKANARGTTVLVATHDPSLLAHYRRRVISLDRGRLTGDTG